MNRPAESPDIETSSDEYARRFRGAVGSWMLNTQLWAVHQMLLDCPGGEVLEVGGGHAQLKGPLVNQGYNVTVLSSDPSCVDRVTPYLKPGRCRFQVGEILNLPYADNAFDTVIAIRLMAHLQDWPRFLREITRVARHTVILDYPSLYSVNYAQKLMFGMKKPLEGDTPNYRCFTSKMIGDNCRDFGFTPTNRWHEFFMPMVLHRTMKMPRLSATIENTCRALGLTGALGSPIVLKLSRTLETSPSADRVARHGNAA